MHTGSYGLMSADNSVQPTGPGGQEGRTPTWPIWSGPVPPLADGFTIRPDTVPGLETTLVPGVTVALVPDQAPSPAWDWRRTSGKTQLARHFAESLWHSPGVDVLTCTAGAVSTPGYHESMKRPAPGTVSAQTVAETALKALGRGPRTVPGAMMRVSSVLMSRVLPRRTAMLWSIGLISYYAWMLTLLLHPVGRAQGFVLLAVTAVAYALRASTSLKWTLVTLTFEGAIRIGMLLSLLGSTWRAVMR